MPNDGFREVTLVNREMSSGTIAVNSYRREERELSRREIMSETRAVKLLTIQMLILTNEKLFHHNVPESTKRILYESAAHSTPISQNHHLSKYSECGQMVVPQNLRPPMRNSGMANRKGSRTHFLINNE